MPLVCTGTIGIDTIELPTGERREGVLGGSCAHFASASRLFTAEPTRIVACVGDDFPADLLEQIDGMDNVDRAGLEIRKGSKSFRWGGKYLEDMDHRETLFTHLGVLEEAPPPVPEAYRSSEFLFLANSHPAIQAGLLEQMAGAKLAVFDTMDLWINVARDDLVRLMGQVDGLVLNFDEAELFTGKRNPITAGRHMLADAPGDRLRFVVIKKGENGALLVHRDGIAAIPAYPAETVIDPTGAGDTFAGGMMGWLASENPADPGSIDAIRRAMAWGTITASFNIEKFSLDRLREVSRKEIDDRYAEYAAMVAFA